MLYNLPYELQVKKLSYLTDVLVQQVGMRLTSFRAGRWGLDRSTIRALMACGYTVDSSVTPFVSWKLYDGPSFDGKPFVPFLVRDVRKDSGVNGAGFVLEIPATIGYNRWPFERYRQLELLLERASSWFPANALAARLNIMKKIWLSPETNSASSMLIVSKLLIDRGIQVLNLTFHSNSLMPGLTPFVKNEDDLERFYDRLRTYLHGLSQIAHVKPAGLSEMRALLGREDSSLHGV
jgi:hypothetical protein